MKRSKNENIFMKFLPPSTTPNAMFKQYFHPFFVNSKDAGIHSNSLATRLPHGQFRNILSTLFREGNSNFHLH